MIDPKELRIGNWLNAYHGDVQVVEIGKEIITTPNLIGATHGAILSPIPLTPEILEKCGFQKIGDYHIKTTRFCFSVSYDGDTFNLYDQEFANGVLVSCRSSKYLHQLQNLIFALTGEELTINHKALSRSH